MRSEISPAPSVAAIFLVALRLGCTSFGGPIAHLAYFREEYVERRRWISEAGYADLVALCQFLPGPASSQVGFGVGLTLRGLAGGLAAWVGFTLPSALLMIGFALGLQAWGATAGTGWLTGLKVAAVAVVAHAVVSMWRTLAPDVPRSLLAVAAAAALLLRPFAGMPLAVIALGAAAGWLLFRRTVPAGADTPLQRTGFGWLAAFAVFLVALPLAARFGGDWLTSADRFYRAGSLVFGGGHVVLPLLEREFVATGGVTADEFLAGYGAAQAMPGPLFTFAAYLGAANHSVASGWPGGLWALAWVFAPGLLLVLGTLPAWQVLRGRPWAQAALRGANAVVVGLLLAALIDPVGRIALRGVPHAALAVAAFAVLHLRRVPPWAVVLACALGGAIFL